MAHLCGCCVCVCCVLCFVLSPNNPVFLSVTIFHILKNENYELCFLANFTFIGKRAYIYLLTLNKKQKIKIMGRVAWLIFVVVVSVCVVFCVLCCLQTIQCSWVSSYFIFWKMKIMSYVFRQISLSIKLRLKKLRQEKKGTVLVFLASVLECHHISYVEKWKLWDIYLLTLNKKWKMKIMGKVARLNIVVTVSVCVVFCVCAASKTIQCSRVSPYFIFWKMKIMSYVFWQISSSIKLRLGKITKGKKGLCKFFWWVFSNVTIFHMLKNENYELCFRQVSSLMKLWPEKITTGKKITMLVYLVLWGKGFWYYLHI